jgi:hypothetical protein
MVVVVVTVLLVVVVWNGYVVVEVPNNEVDE